MRVAFQMYRGTFATWHQLFSEAAAFATRVGQERLISISHSEDQGKGVVTVWFWADENNALAEPETTDDYGNPPPSTGT